MTPWMRTNTSSTITSKSICPIATSLSMLCSLTSLSLQAISNRRRRKKMVGGATVMFESAWHERKTRAWVSDYQTDHLWGKRLHWAWLQANKHIGVIDGLLKEYRIALAKKGLRRRQIDQRYSWALRKIDDERRNPTESWTTQTRNVSVPQGRSIPCPSMPAQHRTVFAKAGQGHGGAFRARKSKASSKALHAAKSELQNAYA